MLQQERNIAGSQPGNVGVSFGEDQRS